MFTTAGRADGVQAGRRSKVKTSGVAAAGVCEGRNSVMAAGRLRRTNTHNATRGVR